MKNSFNTVQTFRSVVLENLTKCHRYCNICDTSYRQLWNHPVRRCKIRISTSKIYPNIVSNVAWLSYGFQKVRCITRFEKSWCTERSRVSINKYFYTSLSSNYIKPIFSKFRPKCFQITTKERLKSYLALKQPTKSMLHCIPLWEIVLHRKSTCFI